MNKLIAITTTVFSLLSLIFVNANAEWYIGADASSKDILPYPESVSETSFAADSLNTYKVDSSTSNLSLFGGYQHTDNFSLELEYQNDLSFGIDDMFAGSSLWLPESFSQNFESNALYLSGIQSYPISDSGVLYMKGGLFNWEIDPNFNETNEKYLGRSSGTDIFYGLGANYEP